MKRIISIITVINSTLDISDNDIGVIGMRHLGKTLEAQPKAFQNLKKIHIRYNNIEDEDMRHFSQALQAR